MLPDLSGSLTKKGRGKSSNWIYTNAMCYTGYLIAGFKSPYPYILYIYRITCIFFSNALLWPDCLFVFFRIPRRYATEMADSKYPGRISVKSFPVDFVASPCVLWTRTHAAHARLCLPRMRTSARGIVPFRRAKGKRRK